MEIFPADAAWLDRIYTGTSLREKDTWRDPAG